MKWIVVQGISRKSVPDLIGYGKQVAAMLQGNAWFPLPFTANASSPALLLQHVEKLSAAYSAPDTGKTKTDDIRLARNTVENDLLLIGIHIEIIANNNEEQGGVIIHSAGMKYRVHGRRKPYIFRVKNTKQEGEVKATAQRNHRDSVYTWHIKKKNESSFAEAGKTLKASFAYKKLKSGERYCFRVRTTTPRRGIDILSQVLELVVL